MSDNTNSQGNNNLKYVFILVGVVALLLSYFLVFSKVNSKISTVSTEIDTLQLRYDDLKVKDADKQNIIDLTEENQKKTNELLSRFDGGITYQSEIMDNYELTEKVGVKFQSLTLSPTTEAYTFGQLASSNPNGGVGGLDTIYKGVSTTYRISVSGTYEQMKEVLKELENNTSKRKSIGSVEFAYNTNDNTAALSLSVYEYAIVGGDREQAKITLPEINTSTTNIFYNSIIKSE